MTSVVQDAFNQMIETLTSAATWGKVLDAVIDIVIILVLSEIVLKVIKKMIRKFLTLKRKTWLQSTPQREKTIQKLLESIVLYLIRFLTILIILAAMGVNMGPLIAGAGVVGIALGFGTQNLIKDVIAGFFIIFENQFSVGDVVEINTFRGTVDEVGLRTTKLHSEAGSCFIIPNGNILSVINATDEKVLEKDGAKQVTHPRSKGSRTRYGRKGL